MIEGIRSFEDLSELMRNKPIGDATSFLVRSDMLEAMYQVIKSAQPWLSQFDRIPCTEPITKIDVNLAEAINELLQDYP